MKWWKLKSEVLCDFPRVEPGSGWSGGASRCRTTSGSCSVREKILGVTSGSKVDKETRWKNEDVQEYVRQKRLVKKRWDTQRTDGS